MIPPLSTERRRSFSANSVTSTRSHFFKRMFKLLTGRNNNDLAGEAPQRSPGVSLDETRSLSALGSTSSMDPLSTHKESLGRQAKVFHKVVPDSGDAESGDFTSGTHATSQANVLKTNLESIQRDLEHVAEHQQLRIMEMSTEMSSKIILNPNPTGLSPAPSIKHRSKSVSSVLSVESTPKLSTSSSHFSTPESTSLRSAMSLPSLDSRTEHEYLLLLEEQGRSPLPIRNGLFRPQTASLSPTPRIHLSKKMLEDSEKSVLAVHLGDGYPDASALMVDSQSGRLLLPSEAKTLGLGRGGCDETNV
ncbi:hypothetical protein HDU98_002671 [Podochytrium sp. JEL0797]|nr:hypothetical protein HDU98_002671 [Podochytrium sp. JEL0797]